MATPEVHTLTGPYVLNALPEDERIGFESHLADCQSCTAEVAELREAAHKLGTAAAVEPPPALKARVMAATATTRQLPPLVGPDDGSGKQPARHRRTFNRRSFFSLAAAGVAVAGAGGIAYDQYRDNSRTQQQNDQLAAVLAEPDAKTLRAPINGGGQAVVVASARRDQAVVVLQGLRELPNEQIYQLWLIDPAQRAFSVGKVSGQAASEATEVIRSGVAGKAAFGLTVERKGGVDQPTLPPAALIPLA